MTNQNRNEASMRVSRVVSASPEATVTHESLPDQQSAEDHTRGWTGTLESLANYFG